MAVIGIAFSLFGVYLTAMTLVGLNKGSLA